jgi:hypothetical protein
MTKQINNDYNRVVMIDAFELFFYLCCVSLVYIVRTGTHKNDGTKLFGLENGDKVGWQLGRVGYRSRSA